MIFFATGYRINLQKIRGKNRLMKLKEGISIDSRHHQNQASIENISIGKTKITIYGDFFLFVSK